MYSSSSFESAAPGTWSHIHCCHRCWCCLQNGCIVSLNISHIVSNLVNYIVRYDINCIVNYLVGYIVSWDTRFMKDLLLIPLLRYIQSWRGKKEITRLTSWLACLAMAGWLAGYLAVWLAGPSWLASWLAGWLAGWLLGWKKQKNTYGKPTNIKNN